MKDTFLSQRFCRYPFTFAEVHYDGSVFLCCPAWAGNRSIGNIFRNTPMELWNSVAAQRIRRGILDGSFDNCDHHVCPLIVSGSLPPKADGDETKTVLRRGPDTVKLAHDDTCNLSCPSCRTGMIVANKERQSQLDRMTHEFIVPFLADARNLSLSGDGDPFASRHYREILRETALNSRLRIDLHTNAVLCDERAWDDCALANRVNGVLVSVDAATSETYSVVRRGGDFERLGRNLAFLSQLRAQGRISYFKLAFVVQARNVLEMPDFVRLGKGLGVDRVDFSAIQHWSRAMTVTQFGAAQVWRPSHPMRSALTTVLKDPILSDPIVNLGNLPQLS